MIDPEPWMRERKVLRVLWKVDPPLIEKIKRLKVEKWRQAVGV